jgi:lipid-A-disaccharide synthase
MPETLTDLFIVAAEPSADLHGAKLIEELLKLRPGLQIAAVAGPRMRRLSLQAPFRMENLQVMGFIDVLFALPKLLKQFFAVRRKILTLNPKAVLFIDYPGFNLRLAKSLRKKNFSGRLIHYICPTVWAWGKKRIPRMAETLDLLLVLFPFEKKCFASTPLRVEYVGHPLAAQIPPLPRTPRPVLALFPGSRETEIVRNFPLQLAAAVSLLGKVSGLEIGVSVSEGAFLPLIRSMAKEAPLQYFDAGKNYEWMRSAKLAIATSGTVTLELALHGVPAVVTYAIRPLDLFLAQKIFRINLPFYCIVNIILSKRVFPELFGPNLNDKNLEGWTERLWFDEAVSGEAEAGCRELREALGYGDASREAARATLSLDF